jgi:hypothetical protein
MENQWKKGVKLNCEDFYKLVGYEFRGKAAGVCLYDIYWLKTYDFGCPEGNTGPYKDYPNNHPSEAVEVSELLGEAILT